VIKDYFLNYHYLNNNLCVYLKNGKVDIYDGAIEDWSIQLIDTGLQTKTGGRVKRLAPWLGNQTFMLTYGDGVSDVNIQDLVRFHKAHGKMATVTAVRPAARYGELNFEGERVTKFKEKPQSSAGWVNGGFFVLEPGVLDYIDGDAIDWEQQSLERLAADGQLAAYRHEGFWQCMDTLRDVRALESLWQSTNPPWKVWP
jgi:glucose-1-phosphate cytidylyltransferase